MLDAAYAVLFATIVILTLPRGVAASQEPSSSTPALRQRLDDAWWTGPMLAPSAATLPRGHVLVEPYVYDVAVLGRYDGDGKRHSAPRLDGFGSLTYILYGVADRMTVGVIPTLGFNRVSDGLNSSGIGLGDIALHAQTPITRFRERRRVPATSLVVEETLPTGKYDRLGDRPSDGLGGGAYTTMLAVYSQMYFWLPNGRILRMRANASHSFSRRAQIADVSVYGTRQGFRGHARPGSTFFVDNSWEYSWTGRSVLAIDLIYRRERSTRVIGYNVLDSASGDNPRSVEFDSGSSAAFGFAPAFEFSWNRNVGVLLGVRVIASGRRTAASISPAIAINMFR